MTVAARPKLEPGRVYRTRDFTRWGANPPRLAKRLVDNGELEQLAHGLYVVPVTSRFGKVPPTDEAVMRAFLDDTPFVFTGPERWNALGLGATAMLAATLVYNTKRSGVFNLGGRQFVLRRVAFPESPPPEWYVVDLFEQAAQVGVSRDELAQGLRLAVHDGRFDRKRLLVMAQRFGTKKTLGYILSALSPAT
jgi:hypothetical protein